MPTATVRHSKSKNDRSGTAPRHPAPKAKGAADSLGSAALSEAIRTLFACGRLGQQATLTDLHQALQIGITWSSEGEIQFPQDRTALVIELDELIDCFGPRARAEDLLARCK